MRVLGATWTEPGSYSDTTYTQSVCPDPECQKLVDDMLKKRHDIYVQRIEDSVTRRAENRKNLTLKKDKERETKPAKSK